MKDDHQSSRPRTQSIDILSCTEETIHLYNEFMSEAYSNRISHL